MLHPDYQYTPKLIRAMTSIIADVYEVVLASRILGGGALKGNTSCTNIFLIGNDFGSKHFDASKTIRISFGLQLFYCQGYT